MMPANLAAKGRSSHSATANKSRLRIWLERPLSALCVVQGGPLSRTARGGLAVLTCRIGAGLICISINTTLAKIDRAAAVSRNGAAVLLGQAMLDWNDLRFFLAVARGCRTLAAALATGLNQSTIQRRFACLDVELGQRLVERLASNDRLTKFGEAIPPEAEWVEKAVSSFEKSLRDIARGHGGIVRVSCPEPIAFRLTQSGIFDRFRAKHPKLIVEFVLSGQYVNLSKGEANVALRSRDTDDAFLVGCEIADSLWAGCANGDYIEKHGTPVTQEQLADHPTYTARNANVLGPIAELTRAWRIPTNPGNRQTRRIAAFFDYVLDESEALRAIFTG